MASKPGAWMDDEDELYKTSIYVRRKLESIEQLAAPDVDERQVQREAERAHRLQRRHQLKDLSVRASVVPPTYASAAAVGLYTVEQKELPVRTAVMDVALAVDSGLIEAPATTGKHPTTPVAEVLFDFRDAIKIFDTEIIENAEVMLIDCDEVARELGLRSDGSVPLTTPAGLATPTKSRTVGIIGHNKDSDEDEPKQMAHSPWAQRQAAISARAMALGPSSNTASTTTATTRTPHNNKATSTPSTSVADGTPSSRITTRRAAMSTSKGRSTEQVKAPPFRELSAAAEAQFAPISAKGVQFMDKVNAEFWKMYSAGPQSSSAGEGTRRTPRVMSVAASSLPLLRSNRPADDYDNYIPRALPNLKYINEQSYVDGYSIKKLWIASGCSFDAKNSHRLSEELAKSDPPRHPRPSDFVTAVNSTSVSASVRDDFIYDVPKIRSRIRKAVDGEGGGQPVAGKRPASARPPRISASESSEREVEKYDPGRRCAGDMGTLLSETPSSEWPIVPAGQLCRIHFLMRPSPHRLERLPVAGAILSTTLEGLRVRTPSSSRTEKEATSSGLFRRLISFLGAS